MRLSRLQIISSLEQLHDSWSLGKGLGVDELEAILKVVSDKRFVPKKTLSKLEFSGILVRQVQKSVFAAIINFAASIHKSNPSVNERCASFYADLRPCSEDCSFCPLSKKHYNNFEVDVSQNWLDLPEKIRSFADVLNESGVSHFKVVTTGAKSDPRIVSYIAQGMKLVSDKHPHMTKCISEGTLNRESLVLLKEAGVSIFNNNLETSEKRFRKIVSSHSYSDKISAITLAKSLGFEICSGGIFGIGESIAERVELFLRIKELGVNSSPFNVFIRYPNLPLTAELSGKGMPGISPNEIFYSIALFRIINPRVRLVLGAGRYETLSEEDQIIALKIGASAVATSGYFSDGGVAYTGDKDQRILQSKREFR
jgi:biotin synthase